MKDIPLVYTCKSQSFEGILKKNAILSKEQLAASGIPYEANSSGHHLLEHEFNTNDDVTLYIDPLFRPVMYGGSLNRGPRLIFSRQLLYNQGVFMLPMDQNCYFRERENPKPEYAKFCEDMMVTREAKDKFIDAMCIKEIMFLSKLGIRGNTALPEVHIPSKVPLTYLRGCLIHEMDIEKYRNRKELEGVELVTFSNKKNGLTPDIGTLMKSFRKYLKQRRGK